MPASSRKSSLFGGKMDQVAAAHEEFKKSELKTGNVGLPPGIDRGVARLTDVKLGEFQDGKQKGEPYFSMSAMVVEPFDFKGQRLYGRITRFGPEPLCDTPERGGDSDTSRKTFVQHMQHVENAIGLLIGKEAVDAWDEGLPSTDPSRGATIEANFLATVDALSKRAKGETDEPPIYFNFKTFQPRKVVIGELHNGRWGLFDEDEKGNRKRNRKTTEWHTKEMAEKANPYAGSEPRVIETWHMHIDGYVENKPEQVGTKDNTGKPSTHTEVSKNGTAADPNADGAVDEDYVNTLLTTIENSDTESSNQAIVRLKELASSAGIPEDEVEASDTWRKVGERIIATMSGVPAEVPATLEDILQSEEVVAPEEKQAVKYVVLDSKTGKPVTDPKTKRAKPAVDCLVESVSVKNMTADLLSMVDRKTKYKNVPWDQLLS